MTPVIQMGQHGGEHRCRLLRRAMNDLPCDAWPGDGVWVGLCTSDGLVGNVMADTIGMGPVTIFCIICERHAEAYDVSLAGRHRLTRISSKPDLRESVSIEASPNLVRRLELDRERPNRFSGHRGRRFGTRGGVDSVTPTETPCERTTKPADNTQKPTAVHTNPYGGVRQKPTTETKRRVTNSPEPVPADSATCG